jgi:signal peptidase I
MLVYLFLIMALLLFASLFHALILSFFGFLLFVVEGGGESSSPLSDTS